MEAFSNENFELKVYLKYIMDKSRDNKHQKCLIDHMNDKNLEELQKFLDKYEFTYVNLTRLETNDKELIPLMNKFIKLYKSVEDIVLLLNPKNEPVINENNINRVSYNELGEYIDKKEELIKKRVLVKEEGNDNNE